MYGCMKGKTQILRLRDRRLLEFAEYGDPAGEPLLYFHGYFGSYHQASVAHEAAKRNGIRVIAPNRPGIGRSSPMQYAMMTQYADDIAQLMDHLKMETFAIMGASDGGCYGLATAYALPHRVRITGICGAIGPMNVLNNLQQMKWIRRIFLKSCHRYPFAMKWFMKGVFATCMRYPRWSYEWIVLRSSDMERKLLIRNDVQQVLWNDYESIFLQPNGVQGLLEEARMYFHWGFDLRDFPEDKRVIFWHGKNDNVVPLATLKNVFRKLRHAKAIPCPGTHLSFLVNDMDAILRRLKSEWQPSMERNEPVPMEEIFFDPL